MGCSLGTRFNNPEAVLPRATNDARVRVPANTRHE
jgi:hypothetical protein